GLHVLDQLLQVCVLAALCLLDDLGRQDVDSIPFALELRSAEKERPTELAILLEQSQITVVPAHPHIEMPQHFFIQGHVRAPDSLGMKPPEVVQKNIECGARLRFKLRQLSLTPTQLDLVSPLSIFLRGQARSFFRIRTPAAI